MKYLCLAAGFVAGYAAFTAVSWLAVRHLTADHAHDTVQLTGWYAPKKGWHKTW